MPTIVEAFGATTTLYGHPSSQQIVDSALKLAREHGHRRWLAETTVATISLELLRQLPELGDRHVLPLNVTRYVEAWLSGERGYAVPVRRPLDQQRASAPTPEDGYHACDRCCELTHETDLTVDQLDVDRYLCPECLPQLISCDVVRDHGLRSTDAVVHGFSPET